MATDRRQAIKKTVQAFHKVGSGSSLSHFILQTATSADECPAWWSLRRDDYLSKFWPTEPFLAGAIYDVQARNASFRWELTGNYETIWRYQRMLNEADFGGGWPVSYTHLTLPTNVLRGGHCAVTTTYPSSGLLSHSWQVQSMTYRHATHHSAGS